MGKILEFENVYLELPDKYELNEEESNIQEAKNEMDLEQEQTPELKTTKLSLEELQRKLEETQSLHL